MRRSVHIVLALLGLLIFRAPADAAPPGVSWDGAVSIAEGGGERGPWRQNASRYDYVDDATVAFTGGGALAVAWVDQKRKDVFLQRVGAADGKPAAPPVNVSRSPDTFSWQPRIAVSKAHPGQVYVLWQEIIFSGGSHGGDILFARSDDGGARFGEPVNLSRSRGGDGKGRLSPSVWSNGSHDLALGADGSVLAAWTEYDGALWFARSRDRGAVFTPPRQVAGNGKRPARAPALASAPGGRVYLAWTVGEDPAADIHLAQSDDGGASFGPPQRIGSGPGHADAPRLAVDAGGALHLVYAEAPAGPGGPARIRHARSPGGANRFGAPRTISGAGPAAGSAAYPAIAADERGGVYVVWEVMEEGAARPGSLAFATARDGGRFTRPSPVPGSAAPRGAGNGSHQGLLGKKLAVDAAGRLAIVNSSLLPGVRSRVWLMRGRLPH